MGREVNAAFPFTGPGFIDYAVSNMQSDLLDVVLFEYAYLSISGSSSGIEQMGNAFNRPLVITNLIPFTDPRIAIENNLITPALLRSKASGEILPLSSMMKARFGSTAKYEAAGLEVVRNSPVEILEVVREALGRLRGTWSPSDHDDELQVEFWKWADKCGVGGQIPLSLRSPTFYRARIGTAFLKRHSKTLFA